MRVWAGCWNRIPHAPMHQNDWGQSNNSHHARLRGVTSKRRSRYNQVAWRRGTSIDAVHAGTAERIRSCRRGAIRLPVRLQGAIRQARMVAGRHSAASSVAGRRPAAESAMCSAELSATGTRARECGFSACMLAARSPKVATLSVVQRHKTLQISSTWRRFAACLQPLYTSLPAASCVQQLEPSAKALIGCH